MTRTTEELFAMLNDLVSGPTDRDDEARILALLQEADAAQLNELVGAPTLKDLIRSVDDRCFGPKNRTKLYELLTISRLAELTVGARVVLINALQQGRTGRKDEEAIRNVFLGTKGRDLTALKNGIDAGEDYRDLQQLIFSDIDRRRIRNKILDHIRAQGAGLSLSAVKALSDIDDTFYRHPLDKVDQRYPRGTTYPGVIQYYEELVRGPAEGSDERGNLVFLTARPKDRTGVIEQHTKESLAKRGIRGEFTVLSGDFLHAIGNKAIAAEKRKNFVGYRRLFPEYSFVFTGDSSQADACFGKGILAEFPGDVRGVFIHDVRSTSQKDREDWGRSGVVFFDTYVGAAVAACKAGLISKEGVRRVIDAARRELQTITFDNDVQRQERETDLERDITAASEL